MTDPTRRVPPFASDAVRGWIAGLGAVVVSLAIPFGLVALGVRMDPAAFIVANVFLSWTVVCLLTAALTVAVFARASAAELRRWLVATQPKARTVWLWNIVNGGGATGWAVSGSLIAVFAVVILSFNPQFRAEPLIVYSGIGVVIASLALTITSYAVRYARHAATEGGIVFPGPDSPRFSDFVYLAIQVSTTFSSSDVTIQSPHARRIVSVNSLVSFAFNTIIIALLVSVLVRVAD